jgi:hypothetical protein
MRARNYCGHNFVVKIAEIFNQKNPSPYLVVSHGNFTIWDDKKEPAVIYRIKKRAEKSLPFPKCVKIYSTGIIRSPLVDNS